MKEKLAPSHQGGDVWLERAKNFLSSAGQASYIAQEGTLEEKREYLQKIGSNFRLADSNLLFSYKLPYSILVKNRRNRNWGG